MLKYKLRMSRNRYTIGHHGTSLKVAEAIETDGFLEAFTGDYVYFATAGRLLVAKTHGRGKALALGEDSFAVITTKIPLEIIEPREQERDIRVPIEHAAAVSVISVTEHPVDWLQ